MESAGGRPDEVWQHVKLLEGGRRVKCNYCGSEFAASADGIKSHINRDKGKGIRVCPNFPQSHNFGSDNKGDSNHSQEAGQIQGDDAKCEERIQVGSSFVSNWENEDLQMMKRYVFECLRPEDKVFVSPLSYLTQEEFITLKPGAHLDSLVIDIFVEILTDIERKKKTVPSNWYLPVTFSDTAVESKAGHFLNFVHGQKMKENYMSDLQSYEKIFIPVHVGARPNGGHCYLYIIHLKNKEIEIWDSLPNTYVAEIKETTEKLFLAMEKLFEKVTFTEFHLKMADDILLQPNGFDCGVFVINYMQQSDNYVKRNPLFQFDSQKEREDLGLKLLTNDLNQEKHNLYDKARGRLYAQVEKQDGNERLRVDPSKEHFEDVGGDMEAEYDDSEEDDGLENDLIRDASYNYDDEEINRECSMKRITFEGVNLENRKVVLQGDIKELVINDCQLVGTVGRCLCSVVLSYGQNSNIPHQIERLDISDCKDVEYLCCFSGSCPFCSSFQLVGRLSLSNLKDLKDIVSPYALLSLHQPDLFSHLTHLEIHGCNNMETLMKPKLLALAVLQNLRTIDVSECEMMKEIVGEDHSQMGLTVSANLSHPTPITLPKLTSLKFYDMPQLNFVYRGIMLCPSLQTFNADECEKLNLPRIEISNGCQLPMEKTSTGCSWEIETD